MLFRGWDTPQPVAVADVVIFARPRSLTEEKGDGAGRKAFADRGAACSSGGPGD